MRPVLKASCESRGDEGASVHTAPGGLVAVMVEFVVAIVVVVIDVLVLKGVVDRVVVVVGVRSWGAAPVMMDTPMRDLSASWDSLQLSFPMP